MYGLSIAQVAERLSEAKKESHLSHQRESQGENAKQVFILTPMQESYLFGANQGCPCQVYTELDVNGLDIEVFEQAVNFVIDRHPMLHAYIVNGTMQRISPKGERRDSIHFHVNEVSDFTLRRKECMDAFQSKPDLNWDIQLTQIDAKTVRIHLLLDMLFIDATSAVQVIREVAKCYRSLLLEGEVDVSCFYVLFDYIIFSKNPIFFYHRI